MLAGRTCTGARYSSEHGRWPGEVNNSGCRVEGLQPEMEAGAAPSTLKKQTSYKGLFDIVFLGALTPISLFF
jgi:hypothetical protein